MAAARGQQFGAGLRVDLRRHHYQSPRSPAAAVLCDGCDLPRRHGEDGEVGRLRQVGDGWDGAHAEDGRCVRVDRVQPAAEAGPDHVSQDRVPDPAGFAAGADDRDRGRLQQVPQAGDVGEALAHRHRVQVAVQLLVGLVGGQREGRLDHPFEDLSPRGQAGVGEHPQHRDVVGQRLRGEGAHAAEPRSRDEVIEQQARDAAPVHMVGHRERDLGDSRLVSRLVAGDPDQLISEPGEQREVAGIGRPADARGLPARRLRTQAEEAQVGVGLRHLRVHLPDGVLVLRPCLPDQDRRAIGEQRVDPVR